DYAQAAKWYRLAADQGFARAQYNLGRLYQTGNGVPQDLAEAVKLYRLAAFQGDASGQASLGTMYATGAGVPQDFITAHMWFNLADANGLSNAAGQRDEIASQLKPADLSEAQRRAKVCMA